MKKAIRLCALLMAVAMCLTVVGCKSEPEYESYLSYYYEDVETDTNADTTSEKDTSKTSSKKKTSSRKNNTNNTSSNKVENDVDLKHYKFVISSAWMAKTAKDATMEQEKSFFKVAKEIEKKYGCTISISGGNIADVETLQNLVMSKSKVADALDMLSSSALQLAAAGLITPWNEINGIDPTNPKFVQGYTNLSKVGSDCYGISFMRAPEARMCVIFNKGLLEGAGINVNNMYQLVRDKKWTWDVFADYADKITKKNTVGGVVKAYGVGGSYVKITRALYESNGAQLAGINSSKKGVALFRSNQMSEALNFLDKLVNTDKSYDKRMYTGVDKFNINEGGVDAQETFQKGELGFLVDETYWVSKYFNKSFDYGIVPVPMGKSAKKYISSAGNARVLCCTSTNAKSKTIDKSVAILNLIADGCAAPNGKYAGEEWWQYDLKQEYFRNDKDANLEMYNIILNSSSCDYGANLEGVTKDFFSTVIRDGIYLANGTISSNLAKMGSQYDKTIEKAFSFK